MAIAGVIIASVAIAIPINAATGTSIGSAQATATASSYTFQDSFTSLNSSQWQVQSSGQHSSKTTWSASNVQVANGDLVLVSNTKDHTGGFIAGKTAFGYGKYTTSLKTNLQAGNVFEIWMYQEYTNGYNDIQMTFQTSNNTNTVYLATNVNGSQSQYTYKLPFDPSADFHTYGYNWQSGRVDFIIDGATVWSSTSNVPTQGGPVSFAQWVQQGQAAGTVTTSNTYVDWLKVEYSSAAPTVTPTATAKPTVTPTATAKPTVTPTATAKPTATPTATAKPTATPTPDSGVIAPPAPSSKYALYDTFSSDTGLWQKDNRVWKSSLVNTTFQAANVYLSNGNLVLYSNNDKHIGGEIVTKQKYSYGKYRASIKTATLNAGCFETFYSYIWSPHNEIDGPELWKHEGQNGPVMVNENSALGDGSGTNFGVSFNLAFDPSKAYHVYGYNWYPGKIEFVIDDKVVATTTQHVPNQPMNIYFQNWVYGDSNMPKDHGNGQNYELVDWVTYEPCTS